MLVVDPILPRGIGSKSRLLDIPVDGDAWTRSAGAVSTPHRPHGSAGSSAPSQNLEELTLVAAEPNPTPIERLDVMTAYPERLP